MTKHLVIDEMQDYTPVQYAVLNEMFRCHKTILGDFGQRLNPDHLHTLKDIRRMYKSAEFVMLNKATAPLMKSFPLPGASAPTICWKPWNGTERNLR